MGRKENIEDDFEWNDGFIIINLNHFDMAAIAIAHGLVISADLIATGIA